MKSKKILIINPITLFPKVMASQDRLINMIKRLGRDHTVDVVTYVKDKQQWRESMKHVPPICNRFFPITTINARHKFIRSRLHRLRFYLAKKLFHTPVLYSHYTHRRYFNALDRIVREGDYDVVQMEYWFAASYLERVPDSCYKAIDTIDIMFDKKRQELIRQYGEPLAAAQQKELARYKELEIKALGGADLHIAISKSDRQVLDRLHPEGEKLLIPSGQDVEHFSCHSQPAHRPRRILFYGSMGSDPNIQGFFRFWNNILPLVRRQCPDVEVLVLGANPPESIRRLHNGKDVIVTGFVEDVRTHIASAAVLVLPLNVAAGFRSRIVDVMAMGVPVIGTKHTLHSIDMEHGMHGYISERDEELAAHAVSVLQDPALRKDLSDHCVHLASNRYTIDATFGALSRFYLEQI
jgi:glycosyltransferase involved in cell wall biosynthesis